MSNLSLTRRGFIASATSSAALGLAALARATNDPTMPPIVSEPIVLGGRLIRSPRETPINPPVMFQSHRAGGFTNFLVEHNDVLMRFIETHAGSSYVQMRCRIKNAPGANTLTLEPLSIAPGAEEPLPNWDIDVEYEPFTSIEEETVAEIMRIYAMAWMDNPDSQAAQELLQQYAAAFARMDDEPDWISKGLAIPSIVHYRKGDLKLSYDSTYGYFEEGGLDPTEQSNDRCIVAILGALLLVLVQFIVNTKLGAKLLQEIGKQAQRLFNSRPIRNWVQNIIDVFTRRGLRGNQRGDLFRGALSGFFQVAAIEVGRSMVPILKALPWYLVCTAIASALCLVAKIAGLIGAVWGAIDAIAQIVRNCGQGAPLRPFPA